MFSGILYLLLLGALSFQELAKGAPAHPETTGPTRAEEEEDLKKQFREYDLDGNGEIDAAELKSVVIKFDLADGPVSDGYAENMIRKIDTDHSGTVNFKEFGKMMGKPDPAHQPDADEMFDSLVTNKNGFITTTAMRNSGMFDEAMISFAMKEADTNNDRRLDRQEFRALLKKIAES